ncbi:MAG: hypothetical protein ABJL72_12460 [Roseobacter sp.]
MKHLTTALAYFIILIGLVSMFTPMPGGTLLIVAGCTLLICSNARVASKVKSLRTRKPTINKWLTWIEDKVGERMSGPMRSTRPDMPPVQEQNL